ncbi:g1260 [Coccomyxa elongata]
MKVLRRSLKPVAQTAQDEEVGTQMTYSDFDTKRLFSNLDSTLAHQRGSVAGASILVAGTTIGAGILAVPYTTQDAGFVPSSAAILGTYVFSIVTGLLLAEANINLMCELGKGGVSITSIAQATLGRTGARLSSSAYLLLHYSLLVAYTAKSGEICDSLRPLLLGGPAAGDTSSLIWSVPFCGTLAAGCYFLKPRQLDRANGVLLAAVLLSFMGLLWQTAALVNPANLVHSDWTAVPKTLPVLSLAFVYQNVVPIICSSLEGDLKRVRQSIIFGLSIPLVMFVAWNGAILGSLNVPLSGAKSDPLEMLTQQSPSVGILIQIFSLLAIATSYIGFVLGLADFLSDLLKLPSGQQNSMPFVLTVVPPFVLAAMFPDLFFKALDLAGTYGVLSLFGLLPAAAVWSRRSSNQFSAFRAVPGGKFTLLATGGIAGGIIANQLLNAVFTVLSH